MTSSRYKDRKPFVIFDADIADALTNDQFSMYISMLRIANNGSDMDPEALANLSGISPQDADSALLDLIKLGHVTRLPSESGMAGDYIFSVIGMGGPAT